MLNTSANIKEPGLNVLPPGVERYMVNGGGLTGVQILPDDEIEIINNEGNQICEISVFNKEGKSEPAILNLKENNNVCEIKKILAKNKPTIISLGMYDKGEFPFDRLDDALLIDTHHLE